MFRIIGKNLIELTSSGIYAWKRNEEYLYIGKSYKLIQRIINHDIINIKEKLLPDDIIEIYTHERTELDRIERDMIRKHRPKYNKYFYDLPLPIENNISIRSSLQVANSEVIMESIAKRKITVEMRLAAFFKVSLEQWREMCEKAQETEKIKNENKI